MKKCNRNDKNFCSKHQCVHSEGNGYLSCRYPNQKCNHKKIGMKKKQYCKGTDGWDCCGDYRSINFQPEPKYAHLDFGKYCKQCGKLIPKESLKVNKLK